MKKTLVLPCVTSLLMTLFLGGADWGEAAEKGSLTIPRLHQQAPPKMEMPKPVGLNYTPDDAWDNLFVQEIVALKERVQQLESRVAQLEVENDHLKAHRHGYKDRFIGGNQWISIATLRNIINNDEQHQLNNFGVYFRAVPLDGKGFPQSTTEPPQ